MPDAITVGFVPFSTARRGILVVFCDDALKFGPATSKILGRVAGLGSGASDFLTKPFSPRALVQRIEELLQKAPNPAQIATS